MVEVVFVFLKYLFYDVFIVLFIKIFEFKKLEVVLAVFSDHLLEVLNVLRTLLL